MDLALDNLQRLICHKTHKTKLNQTIHLYVWHRTRTKQHLVVLVALFILLYKSTLCKQNPKHLLNLLGDNFS